MALAAFRKAIFRRLLPLGIPAPLLHLESLEETRTQEKESDAPRCRFSSCLCMEQHAQRWMGGSAKSYSDYHDHTKTIIPTRLRIHA